MSEDEGSGGWKFVSVVLVTVLVSACFIGLYVYNAPNDVGVHAAVEPSFIDVSVEGLKKLGVNETGTYEAIVNSDVSEALEFVWSISPQDNMTVLSFDGAKAELTFVEATEEPYLLTVQVEDLERGNFGTGALTVYDPYTSPNVYLGSFGAPYSYMIESDGLGWYRAIKGEDGSVFTSGIDSSIIQTTILDSMTSGTLLLKGVSFDLALMNSIPANVQVVCSYGDEQYTYINSADTLGSPYTVSVGSGVNVGYYLAQDSEGRICYTSTNISDVINTAIVNNSIVQIGTMTAELLSTIEINGKSNITLIGDNTATLLYTSMNDALIQITYSTNINIKGLWLQGDSNPTKSQQRGIQIYDHCSNILIEENRVENMGYDGIVALYTVDNLKIVNNDVIGCQDDGINPGGGGGAEEGITHTIVSGNYMANMGGDGLHLSDVSTKTIAIDNVIVNCGYGISIYNSSRHIISNNIIEGCKRGIGIVFGVCPYLTISNNLINGTTVGDGISLVGYLAHFSKVQGNTILNPATYGINIGACNNVEVTDNTVVGGTRGIYVSALYVNINDNHVYTPLNYGIVLSGANTGYSTVTGNIVQGGCSSGGIWINSVWNTITANNVKATTGIVEDVTNGDYNIFTSCQSSAGIIIVGANTKVNLCYNGTVWIP